MRDTFETYHMCDGLQGLARILDHRFCPSQTFLDQKPENGCAIELLETIFQFELVGSHLKGKLL